MSRRAKRQCRQGKPAKCNEGVSLGPVVRLDGPPGRRALLASTALASVVVFVAVAPPAKAQVNCLTGQPAPGPIAVITPGDAITCEPTEFRTDAGNVIDLQTAGANRDIFLNSGSRLISGARGMRARTDGTNSFIAITNTGEIDAISAANNAFGIFAETQGDASFVTISNGAGLIVEADSYGRSASGIVGRSFGAAAGDSDGSVRIENSGELDINAGAPPVYAGNTGRGIEARTRGNATGGSDKSIVVDNSGDFDVLSSEQADGIFAINGSAASGESRAEIVVHNTGDFDVESVLGARGIYLLASGNAAGGSDGGIRVENSGDFDIESGSGGRAEGLVAFVERNASGGSDAGIRIENSGNFDIESGRRARGIYARGPGNATGGSRGGISIENSGDVKIGSAEFAYGIAAENLGGDATDESDKSILIGNSGDFDIDGSGGVSGAERADGIFATSINSDADGGSTARIAVVNTGDLDVDTDALTGNGVYARSTGNATDNSDAGITVLNEGDLDIDATFLSRGIQADSSGDATGGSNTGIRIENAGAMNIYGSNGSNLGLGEGIFAIAGGDATDGSSAGVFIRNTGDMDNYGFRDANGINVSVTGDASGGSEKRAEVENSGDMRMEGYDGSSARGVIVTNLANAADGSDTSVTVRNSGDFDLFHARNSGGAQGINAVSTGNASDGSRAGVSIHNTGDVDAETGEFGVALGVYALATGSASGGSDKSIKIENEGDVDAKAGSRAGGINVLSTAGADGGSDAGISIDNSGDFVVEDAILARGIYARTTGNATNGSNAGITIENSGDFAVDTEGQGYGILAQTDGSTDATSFAGIVIQNSGDLDVTSSLVPGGGISAQSAGSNAPVSVQNSGDITAFNDIERAAGAYAASAGENSPVTVNNSGDFRVATSGEMAGAYGILTRARGNNSATGIHNAGDMQVLARGTDAAANGIFARGYADNTPIAVSNSGDFWVESASGEAFGIEAQASGPNSTVWVENTGDLDVTSHADRATGINATVRGNATGGMGIRNTGDVSAQGLDRTIGLYVAHASTDLPMSIWNSGDVYAHSAEDDAFGIQARPRGARYSPVDIVNHGDARAVSEQGTAAGIYARITGIDNPISIVNTGAAHGDGAYGFGILVNSYAESTPVNIDNAGSAYGTTAGIRITNYRENPTTIANTGEIAAASHLAIDVKGPGTADIHNEGTITGFVDLTDQDDLFINESGGVFEVKQTSLFGLGNDLFDNRSGGTVLAATDASKSEVSGFIHLETFKNAGLISMMDGKEGDSFTIANTPGGTDLDYHGRGGTLGVDAFLGGPGSKSDTFTIEGNVSGKTYVDVFNTNPGGGAFNDEGIPVVFATGETPDENAFRLASGPIEAGFFDYDLFFEETGSGQWEFRSFPGANAQLLPQLLTAAQDIWHQSSSTWFDRTADLRVLLNADAPLVPTGDKILAAPVAPKFTPAAWLKTGGQWLDRDATAQTKAYGRTYTYNLDRELESFDLQTGVDFGSRDVLGAGDALVFGVLGGFVMGDLSYDNRASNFDYSGGQVGAYATYLNGGLFVDTLLNVHIYDLETRTRGMPNSIDGNTVGLRTDAGYRFGSFTGGLFVEPLATLEVMWVDLDGFANSGNRVSFSDDANVRGRLGLRAGTSGQFTETVLWEPFVIGSVWGNLSDDNTATLVSSGRTFRFVDDAQDVWGEVSAGVNFFNLSQSIAVFGKVDVSFGDDLTGIGGQGGMRVAW